MTHTAGRGGEAALFEAKDRKMSGDTRGRHDCIGRRTFAAAVRRLYGALRVSLRAYVKDPSPWSYGTSRYHLVTRSTAQSIDGDAQPPAMT